VGNELHLHGLMLVKGGKIYIRFDLANSRN